MSFDKAAGDTGIFGGGVGGTGEFLGAPWIEDHVWGGGMERLGKRLRDMGDVESLVAVGVTALTGCEEENDIDSSLISDSKSVASYNSSRPCI